VARARTGGRPKGLSDTAQKKTLAAQALYHEGDMSADEIAENIRISKATLIKIFASSAP
jgi:predicted DNA-binding protein YlxM (UPF0122 family)